MSVTKSFTKIVKPKRACMWNVIIEESIGQFIHTYGCWRAVKRSTRALRVASASLVVTSQPYAADPLSGTIVRSRSVLSVASRIMNHCFSILDPASFTRSMWKAPSWTDCLRHLTHSFASWLAYCNGRQSWVPGPSLSREIVTEKLLYLAFEKEISIAWTPPDSSIEDSSRCRDRKRPIGESRERSAWNGLLAASL